jgi:exopolyphosphatase / guanosine-5'-triphosphate,3'-diphosphate pyrophosphatase
MNDEGLPSGGLDANGTVRNKTSRSARWGRRTPYGIRHDGRDERHAPIQQHPGATYAALDLGTNNCRLLIARPTADGFRVVDAFSRIIRLGEGVASSRRIS